MRAMKLGLLAGAVLVAAFGIALAHPGHPPVVAPKVTFGAEAESVPFQLFRGSRVVIPIVINGHRAEAMLDTGASMTTLDRDYARSIGLPEGFKIEGKGTGGIVQAELLSGINIQLGANRFADMSVGVMDLSGVARGIGRPTTVVLGRDLFNSAIVSIDWTARTLRIHSPATFTPPARATALVLSRKGPFNTIPVSVAGGKPIEALFDLGSSGALDLPRTYWGTRPDISKLRWAESRRGGVGGLTTARNVTLPQVTLAGSTFEAVPALLSDAGNDEDPTQMANVGIQFLKQFNVDLDLGHDRLFLTPRADAPGFDRDRAGVRFELRGDRLKVVFVSPGSPAARGGLKDGDEVVAVNGTKVDKNFYQRPDWAQGPAGKTVSLTRADGTLVSVRLADYF